MSEKLKQLEEHKVIQEVSGSTSWINRLVVAEKAKGDIWICLDKRYTNHAILSVDGHCRVHASKFYSCK